MATATLEDWQGRLERLEAASASGTLVVRHGDTSVTYRSMDELMRAIAYAQGKVDKLSGTTSRGPKYAQQNTKGL